MRLKLFSIAVSLVALEAASAQTGYNVTLFSAPNALQTYTCGIDSSGDVAGWYVLSHGYILGFTRSADGTFTRIIPPVKQSHTIQAGGINDFGSIVGSVEGVAFVATNGAYEYLGDQKHPASGNGINNSGTFVGVLRAHSQDNIGFIQSAGKPPYVLFLGQQAAVFGINNSGTAVGYYQDDDIGHGFSWTEAGTQTLDVPGASSTAAFGINDNGVIVGGWNLGAASQPPLQCGEFEFDTQGFVYSNGEFTTFNVGGALATAVYGVNNAGQLAGTVYISTTEAMGFIATPQ